MRHMTRETRKVTVTVVTDDLTGEELPQGEGETVEFSWDGKKLEIDLGPKNAMALRQALNVVARYAEHAREVKKRPRPRRPVPSGEELVAEAEGGEPLANDEPKVTRLTDEQNAALRAWARKKGFNLSDRGRIPQWAIDAWLRAQMEEQPPVRLVPPPAVAVTHPGE